MAAEIHTQEISLDSFDENGQLRMSFPFANKDAVYVDEETGEVIHGPDMISKGFVFEQQFSHLLEDAKCLVLDHLETSPRLGIPRLGDRIRSSLRSFFRKVVGLSLIHI